MQCLMVSFADLKCYSNATYELCGNVENGLEGKPPPAKVEKVFEAGSEKLHHQGVVLPARAEVVHLRYTLYMCVMNYTDRQKWIIPQITPNKHDIIPMDATRNETQNEHNCIYNSATAKDLVNKNNIHIHA